MGPYDEVLVKIVMAIMSLIGLAALYVIIRMIVNRCKGKDELDGLL
ncbi:hypothetical protein RG47T_0880 [Mucilaginibacter polytrichastri]|uniref:Uncharacterized protein n=1 Tax=Mucilaginibacter polytrichastri TaxID=1302689 RepID=A0A1Q5ZUJ2_9SPHI|nr:hypothetical protein RG47T_0880 [Mucilaginibacter polytrichastri]SFS38923.1 hypothetical protein SAMN04487890_101215 [Mucilaginibacter polytrichastri]